MSAYCIHGKWSLPADSHLFTSSKQTPSPQVPIIRYDTIRYLNTLNCTCPAATDLPASPASAVWLRILQLYAINWGDHSLVRVAHVVACWLLLCVEHSVRHVSRLLFPLTTIENKTAGSIFVVSGSGIFSIREVVASVETTDPSQGQSSSRTVPAIPRCAVW